MDLKALLAIQIVIQHCLFVVIVITGKVEVSTTPWRQSAGAEAGARSEEKCRPLFVATQAGANIFSNPAHNDSVSGSLQFEQPGGVGPVTIAGSFAGLTPGKHAIHIHEFGNILEGCQLVGNHYNPDNYTHGRAYDAERHAGDLGNLNADENGNAEINIVSNAFSLNGEYSIIGRSVVLHQDEDDGGRGHANDSSINGHSGQRIACGAIALSHEQPADSFASSLFEPTSSAVISTSMIFSIISAFSFLFLSTY